MVRNGVVITKYQGNNREEFCQHDSEGNWVCITAVIDPSVRIRPKGKVAPFLLAIVGESQPESRNQQ